MRDFDIERAERELRDRSFKIGGEEFTFRAAVSPETLIPWSKMIGGEYVERNADGTIVLGPDKEPVSSLTEELAIQIYDKTALAFLEPGQEEKWARVRSPDALHPLNLNDLTSLIRWLFEEQTGRPTGPPSSSSASTPGARNGGSETSATESTDASPSPTAALA